VGLHPPVALHPLCLILSTQNATPIWVQAWWPTLRRNPGTLPIWSNEVLTKTGAQAATTAYRVCDPMMRCELRTTLVRCQCIKRWMPPRCYCTSPAKIRGMGYYMDSRAIYLMKMATSVSSNLRIIATVNLPANGEEAEPIFITNLIKRSQNWKNVFDEDGVLCIPN